MSGPALILLAAVTSAFWLGLGLGSGIGLLHGLVSYVANRFAMRQNQRLFMLIVIGGMLVRMLVALSLVALVLLILPVDQVAFIGSFFGVFVIGLIGEVWSVLRHLAATKDADATG
jgi:hypothetical protein